MVVELFINLIENAVGKGHQPTGAIFYQTNTSTPASCLFLSTALIILFSVDEPAVSVSLNLLLMVTWLKYLLLLNHSLSGKISSGGSTKPAGLRGMPMFPHSELRL